MAIENAKLWMQKHSHVVPAIAINHDAIIELLDDEHQAHNLSDFTTRDPGLLLGLLAKVNARRTSASTKDPVESPQSAISLLGDHATRIFFKQFPVAEKELSAPKQLTCFLQIINRCFHNREQAEMWSRLTGYKQVEPIKLAGLLAYTGELLCCCYDFATYQTYLTTELDEASEEQCFGFQFDELSLCVAEKFNLPSLIRRSIPKVEDSGQRSQLIKYLSLICKYCEHDWYSDQMLQTQQQFADYLKLPVDRVVSQIHQNSVQAAHHRLLKDSWQAAAKLILLPDLKKTNENIQESKPHAVEKIAPSGHETVLQNIKLLLKKPGVSQSKILNTCIHGLHTDLGLAKVSLLLLSGDKKNLQNRMNVGSSPDSPLKHFKIEVNRAGLLKALLTKPQAIWINRNTLKKYHKMIPQSFLASTMSNEFFAMSLFIGNKAIGIIYADHSESSQNLDKALFDQFKHTVMTTSKALTFLARKTAAKQ